MLRKKSEVQWCLLYSHIFSEDGTLHDKVQQMTTLTVCSFIQFEDQFGQRGNTVPASWAREPSVPWVADLSSGEAEGGRL